MIKIKRSCTNAISTKVKGKGFDIQKNYSMV